MRRRRRAPLRKSEVKDALRKASWTETPDGWAWKSDGAWFVLQEQEYSDVMAAEQGYKYECVVKHVALDTFAPAMIAHALRAQEMRVEDGALWCQNFKVDDEYAELVIVCACSDRTGGFGAPLEEFCGDDEAHVLDQAWAYVRTMLPAKLKERLDRKVNACGDTAYAFGVNEMVLPHLREPPEFVGAVRELLCRLGYSTFHFKLRGQ